MYFKKKELIIVIIGVFILCISLSFLFEGNITGAVISSPDLEINLNDSLIRDSFGEDPNKFLSILEDASSTQCGTVNENITLTANVNSTGTCFTINATNITLDCNSFTINFTSGYGVNASNHTNITIKNCKFFEKNSDSETYYAIYFNKVNSSLIYNNNVSVTASSVGGIYMGYSTSINVTKNYLNVTSKGVEFQNIDHSFINYNTVNSTDYPISLSSSSNNTIENNILWHNLSCVSGCSVLAGLYMGGGNSNNNTINSNNITYSYSYGFEIQASSLSNNITNNNVNSRLEGFYIIGSSHFNYVANNVINTSDEGIYLEESNHIRLINNTVETNGNDNFPGDRGIYIKTSTNSSVINNTINTYTAFDYGVYIESSFNGTYSDNKINATESAGFVVYGTTLEHYNQTISTSNLVEGLPVVYNRSIFDLVVFEDKEFSSVYGQIICAWCTNVTYNNINISNGGINLYNTTDSRIENSTFDNVKGYGIHLFESDYNNLTNNSVINSTDIGIVIYNSDYNVVLNNTLNKSRIWIRGGDYDQFINNSITDNGLGSSSILSGFSFYIIGTYNTFKGNYLYNNYNPFLIVSSNSVFEKNSVINSTYGYWLYSTNDNFTSETIANNTNGVFILVGEGVVFNNIFWNTTFSGNVLDLNASQGVSTNVTFINCSINKSKLLLEDLSKAYIKWYVDVNVTDSNNNPLDNVTVKAYNSINLLDYESTTNSQGVVRLEMTEFYRGGSITYYVTPSTIEASKNNYTKNSTTLNLFDQTYASVNFTLTEIGCGSNITTDISFGNNYDCTGAGLIIGADNITIDGNNYNLTGNNSAIGINLNGRKNIVITDLIISNFTTGINLLNSNDTNISNSTFANNTYAVIFNNSYDNIIYDSNLTNNYNYSVYALNDGWTNNSLVNVSVNVSKINVTGNATIYRKWYVDVNASYNNINVLVNANASAYFNSSGVLDHSLFTKANGIAKLVLTELKRNVSGTFYLTPHNINISYTYLDVNTTNTTSLNLSQTNNTQVNLSIMLNCTTPTSNFNVNSNTTLCPGTFESEITINANNINLTCVDTILQAPTGYESVIDISSKNNVTIKNCQITHSTGNGIKIYLSENITIDNVIISGTSSSSRGINCHSSYNINLSNSVLSNGYGVSLYACNDSTIFNNSFSEVSSAFLSVGIELKSSEMNTIINNTFSSLGAGIYFPEHFPSHNSFFYYNNFSENTDNIFSWTASINHFNTTTTSNLTQGNEYSDYCDKGSDLNNDGYADNVSVSGGDWPYSENISSKVSDATTNNVGVIDYGPKITNCPPTEVFLGSSSGGGGSSASESSAAPAVAPEVGSQKEEKVIEEEPIEEFYDAENAKKHLKTQTAEIFTHEKITKVKVALENTGTKRMSLFPGIFQEIEDPFFIVTTKTLGFEGSFFSKLAHLSYSEQPITGRLLKAEILDPEQIVLEPGEKIEKVLEIKEGLITPRQIKVQFTTFDEIVTEQEVEIKQSAVSGTAVDIDNENYLMDIYTVIVPKQLAEGWWESPEQEITGAITAEPNTGSQDYTLEFNIESADKKNQFTDLYGPYHLEEEQAFVFAQQIKFNPEIYNGNYIINSHIYQGGNLVVKNKFDVELGGEQTKRERKISNIVWIFLTIFSFILLIILTILIIKNTIKFKGVQ